MWFLRSIFITGNVPESSIGEESKLRFISSIVEQFYAGTDVVLVSPILLDFIVVVIFGE
jgi:hypothetical protein